MTSCLDIEFKKQTRPISQLEFSDKRESLMKRLRVGEVRIEHRRCRHFYFALKNGKKEKESLETGNKDCGNCSVCWKLSKTPRRLRDQAYNMVEDYSRSFYDQPKRMTHALHDLETIFYTWLYKDRF